MFTFQGVIVLLGVRTFIANTMNEVSDRMKKDQKVRMSFRKIKQRYPQLKEQSVSSHFRHLVHLESSVLNQIRQLEALPTHSLSGYEGLLDDYVNLAKNVSERLLQQYNQKNNTHYDFTAILKDHYVSYLKAGILSVLISNHIPQKVRDEFRRLLPENPADEYPQIRRQKRTFYLHLGETNTGKTYQALQRLKSAERGIYLVPLRILALENFERLNADGIPCNLVTGEEEVLVEGATHVCCTIEKLNLNHGYDIAVIDEVQLLADSQRGDAWTKAILGLRCPEIHLCGAFLAKEQLLTMIRDCGDNLVLKEYHRLVPLMVESCPAKRSDIAAGDALVAFSKRSVLAYSRYYAQRGIANSIIYGDLPPEVRRLQYRRFIDGTNPILIATDAIGMGINLPIRRVIFTEVEKYDGTSFRTLTSQEVKQIAGRAGRIGIYPTGYVTCFEPSHLELISKQLEAADDPVECAVLGPSEVILSIGLLPLREKLALWSEEQEHLPYYKKKDIDDFLLILDLLREFNLPEPVLWRLMHIPFNTENNILLEQFYQYAKECFQLHMSALSKPSELGETCGELEVFYQQIGLYYSFSKTMNLELDLAFVTKSRARISQQINNLLLEGLEK